MNTFYDTSVMKMHQYIYIEFLCDHVFSLPLSKYDNCVYGAMFHNWLNLSGRAHASEDFLNKSKLVVSIQLAETEIYSTKLV